MPVIIFPVTPHQPVGQGFGLHIVSTTANEQRSAPVELLNFPSVPCVTVRPGPAIGVGGGRVRRRGFGIRHNPVDFLKLPHG
jgi:hypothetical protein